MLIDPVEMLGTAVTASCPEPHDGALAELFLDLAHRHLDGLVTLARIPFFGHGYLTACRRHRSGRFRGSVR